MPRASAAVPAGARTGPLSRDGFGLLLLILVGLTITRLLASLVAVVDLFPDEAQYWAWSRDWALGYFSKPPLLAWIIGVATWSCGNAEPCVRAPAPLFYFGTCLLTYAIGRTLYDARTAFWAGLTMAFGIGTAFSARIISTDVPLLFFWALALLAYLKFVERPAAKYAVVLGLSLGFGLLAKYAMAYFLLGMALAAVLDRDAREALRSRAMLLALALALGIVAPNLYWNLTHELATFRSTQAVIAGRTAPVPLLPALEFLGAQFAVGGPIVFAVFLCVAVRMQSHVVLRTDRLMLAFALPPLAVITAIALTTKVNANWAAPSFVSATVLAAAWLTRRNAVIFLKAGVALGIAVQVLLLIGDAFAYRVSIPPFGDVYYRTLGWRSFAASTGTLADRIGATAVVGDERRDIASLLYYRRDHPQAILAWRAADDIQFDGTHAFSEAVPDPVLFVSECPFPERLRKFYERVEPIEEIISPAGPTSARWHGAFRLAGRRAPIEPLAPCLSAAR
ncbi:MAG: glycosyltransferase family 39 protein [Xanthobacteraceae bacterium]